MTPNGMLTFLCLVVSLVSTTSLVGVLVTSFKIVRK